MVYTIIDKKLSRLQPFGYIYIYIYIYCVDAYLVPWQLKRRLFQFRAVIWICMKHYITHLFYSIHDNTGNIAEGMQFAYLFSIVWRAERTIFFFI